VTFITPPDIFLLRSALAKFQHLVILPIFTITMNVMLLLIACAIGVSTAKADVQVAKEHMYPACRLRIIKPDADDVLIM
jgi:hypothetical protein